MPVLDPADAILDDCEASGEDAGIIVSLAACSTLKAKCPPASQVTSRSGQDVIPNGERDYMGAFIVQLTSGLCEKE